MQKLSKTEEAQLDTYMAALVEAYEALGAAAETFNAALEEAWAAFAQEQERYNAVVDDWNAWRLQVGADGREYFDERSEKWQESHKGQAYAAWIEPYEDEYLFERSTLESPEPVEIEVNDPTDEMTPFAAGPEE